MIFLQTSLLDCSLPLLTLLHVPDFLPSSTTNEAADEEAADKWSSQSKKKEYTGTEAEANMSVHAVPVLAETILEEEYIIGLTHRLHPASVPSPECKLGRLL